MAKLSRGLGFGFRNKQRMPTFPATRSDCDDLTISLEGIDLVDMVLLDIQGKVLMQKTGLFNQDRINLSPYVAGTYFVRIMTPEGSKEIRITKQ